MTKRKKSLSDRVDECLAWLVAEARGADRWGMPRNPMHKQLHEVLCELLRVTPVLPRRR